MSQFLIFLTATQRTQRLKTFAFAASRALPPPFDSALWSLCRCEPLSDFLTATQRTQRLEAFTFAISCTLSIPRRGRCAAVSQFLIFLTATQRTQRLEAFAFAASRPLSLLRCGRCAAVSQLLIFLTATQRTQRLEAFGFAASRQVTRQQLCGEKISIFGSATTDSVRQLCRGNIDVNREDALLADS